MPANNQDSPYEPGYASWSLEQLLEETARLRLRGDDARAHTRELTAAIKAAIAESRFGENLIIQMQRLGAAGGRGENGGDVIERAMNIR